MSEWAIQRVADSINAAVIKALEETAKAGLEEPYNCWVENCKGRVLATLVFVPEENVLVASDEGPDEFESITSQDFPLRAVVRSQVRGAVTVNIKEPVAIQ